MRSMPFETGPIRPVDEADSLLIRTTRGCPWTACTFCTLYKGMKFSIRSPKDIKKDIRAAREYFKGHPFETCFLQDGDSFVMDTGDLIQILTELKTAFPSLKQISSYGRARTMAEKSALEMKEIAGAGLNKLYCGMESGSGRVLKRVQKGITPEMIIQTAQMAREAGMHTTQFIILGLGGKELSRDHAQETARVLNRVNPDHIRVLTIGIKPGSGLEQEMNEGKFSLLSEAEIIAEQRTILENLETINSHYANHHAVDLLLEIRGQLPQDKERLLAVLDHFLGLPPDRQTNFILGRRLGYYHRLADMENELQYRFVEKQAQKIRDSNGSFEEIFHDLRRQVV
ncbi:B12-binding domain-containing radical SAM protein [Desulfospira joergensenii]|uniref:B12-binding domain-containing radical SAM protein n=1 Tax=Desulfospira joergensenii TaxID=53329 RepID=UPI0003B500B8|nr:radical SAM protein [Desulfospira joergensenii]